MPPTKRSSSAKSSRQKPTSQSDGQPKRHNLTIADIKANITAIFEPLVDKSYDGVDFFDKGGSPFNQDHIDAANALEDARTCILEGMEALDNCKDEAHFNRICDAIMENVEGPLCDAIVEFFNKFLDAVWEGVKNDL